MSGDKVEAHKHFIVICTFDFARGTTLAHLFRIAESRHLIKSIFSRTRFFMKSVKTT